MCDTTPQAADNSRGSFVTREAKQKNSIANSASTSFKRQTAVLEIVKLIRANVHIVHPRIHHEDTLNSDIMTNPIFSSVFVIVRLKKISQISTSIPL